MAVCTTSVGTTKTLLDAAVELFLARCVKAELFLARCVKAPPRALGRRPPLLYSPPPVMLVSARALTTS
jgi:hypothetical protein